MLRNLFRAKDVVGNAFPLWSGSPQVVNNEARRPIEYQE